MKHLRRLWCRLFGHRFTVVADNEQFKERLAFTRTFTATCSWCKWVYREERWAFATGAGAVTYFLGNHYPWPEHKNMRYFDAEMADWCDRVDREAGCHHRSPNAKV